MHRFRASTPCRGVNSWHRHSQRVFIWVSHVGVDERTLGHSISHQISRQVNGWGSRRIFEWDCSWLVAWMHDDMEMEHVQQNSAKIKTCQVLSFDSKDKRRESVIQSFKHGSVQLWSTLHPEKLLQYSVHIPSAGPHNLIACLREDGIQLLVVVGNDRLGTTGVNHTCPPVAFQVCSFGINSFEPCPMCDLCTKLWIVWTRVCLKIHFVHSAIFWESQDCKEKVSNVDCSKMYPLAMPFRDLLCASKGNWKMTIFHVRSIDHFVQWQANVCESLRWSLLLREHIPTDPFRLQSLGNNGIKAFWTNFPPQGSPPLSLTCPHLS